MWRAIGLSVLFVPWMIAHRIEWLTENDKIIANADPSKFLRSQHFLLRSFALLDCDSVGFYKRRPIRRICGTESITSSNCNPATVALIDSGTRSPGPWCSRDVKPLPRDFSANPAIVAGKVQSLTVQNSTPAVNEATSAMGI